MKFPVILFDWGGVVADDPGDDFLSKILVELGATPEQIDQISKTYMWDFMRGKISETAYWKALHEKYGLEIPDTISARFKEWNGLVANQSVLDMVACLRRAEYRCIIFSNVIEPTYNVLEQAGYYALFDGVIASCKIGYAKPDIEMYKLAMEQERVAAREVILIDDKERNLAPARILGMSTILATSGAQIIDDVQVVVAGDGGC